MGQFQESDNRLAAADDCGAAERGVMCQRAPVSSPEARLPPPTKAPFRAEFCSYTKPPVPSQQDVESTKQLLLPERMRNRNKFQPQRSTAITAEQLLFLPLLTHLQPVEREGLTAGDHCYR
ncbi:hypothetical protein CDAR_259561 [Caerostris darwini]|uniref:Uncharacterized protein n=1 Tax=Caerostris darwini TaxID=1538125 RepID=A0AAV4VN83_9ARAC|nr:hypothetical protein CDAR_259561 [Caerostris darwini]